MEQRSEEWHEMRRKHIGGSDAPVIMGISPYKTPYQLWLEKLGLIEPEPINAACQRGIDLEPNALERFNSTMGFQYVPKVIFHPTIDFMMASLDGIYEEKKSIVEIKCNGKVNHEISREGKIPAIHWPQLQHQLAVTGYNCGIYYSFDGEHGVLVRYERDQSYIDILLEKEKEFWDCVTSLRAPPMTSKDKNLVLKKNIVERDDEEWNDAMSMYIHHKDQLDLRQKLLEEAKERLISLSNGMPTRGNGYLLKKNVRKGGISYSDVPELQGVDLDKYRKPDNEFWTIEKL